MNTELGRNVQNAAMAVAPGVGGAVTRLGALAARGAGAVAASPIAGAVAPFVPVAAGGAALQVAAAPPEVPAVAPVVARPAVQPAAAAPVVVAPAQPATSVQGAGAQPGTPAAVAAGASPLMPADNTGIYNRAGGVYRDIAASQNTPQGLRAGAGAVIPVDRQAERNAKFDEEQMRYNANRVGGRGGEAMLHSADAMMAARLGAASADAQRAATAENLDVQQAGETQRTAIRTTADTAQADRRQNTADAEAAVRIGVGKQSLSDAQRVSKLKAQLEATTDPEQRKHLERQLLVEHGKEPNANRFTVVPGGQSVVDGQIVREPATVIDNQTGQPVQTGAQQKGIHADPKALAIKNDPKLSIEQKRQQLQALGYK
jgi:hypothetical protein